MCARRREVRAGWYESSSYSTKRHVDVDRARDLHLRGAGGAPLDAESESETWAAVDDEQRARGDADDNRRRAYEEREAARPRGHWAP